jgi:hypothetical protein
LPLILVLPVLVSFGTGVTRWQRQFSRPDTREIVAEWFKAGAPRGTRIAVENSGPTYLNAAGFAVTDVELLGEHPVEWYAARGIEYLVISSTQAWSEGYADAGLKMFDVPSSLDRPGPSVRIVRLTKP